MSDLRDLLKGQTISSTSASNLNTVGGRVYLDGSAVAALNDLARIIESWRGVRVPTYGSPIPGTGDTAVKQFEVLNTIETVFAPRSGEVAYVQMITVQNAGGAPLTLDLFLTDADGTNIDVLDDLVLGPGDVVNLMTQSSIAFPQFSADESLVIRGRVVSGTPGDCYAKVNYILTAQA